jgi:MFS family permease
MAEPGTPAGAFTMNSSRGLLPALCVTLIISWGSLYYAFAVMTRSIQSDRQWSSNLVMGAYSVALLVAGLCAYPVGKVVDRWGGRYLMTLGSGLAGVLFVALSLVDSILVFYLVWIGLGLAMAMTLYEAAFGVIVSLDKENYRKSISILTLAGGFASTIFWPFAHLLVSHLGWRDSAMVLGLLHVLVCVPLHWCTIPDAIAGAGRCLEASVAQSLQSSGQSQPRSLLRHPSFWLIGLSFMGFGFITSAVAAHVIPMMESRGFSPAEAVALAALIGPMQTSGRAIELVFGKRIPARLLGAVTVLLMPVGLLSLFLAPPVSPSSMCLSFCMARALA